MYHQFKDVKFHQHLERHTVEHKDTQFSKFIHDFKDKLSWVQLCANEAFNTTHAIRHIDTIQHSDILLKNIASNRSIDWRQLNLGNDVIFTVGSRSPSICIQDILTSIVDGHSPLQWDFDEVSKSPAILMEDVDKHPDLPWCYSTMSCNPNLTEEFVERHLDKPWNYVQLSGHDNISFAFIQKHALPYDNWLVSCNSNLTIKLIEHHIKMGHKFDPNGLSLNPNLTWDAMKRIDGHTRIVWNMYVVSKHIPLTETIVRDNFDTLREGILHNPTLTKASIMEHLVKIKSIYKHKYWLSKHPSMKHCDLISVDVFDPSGWSLNPNLTIQDIYNNPSIPWHWEHVSKNTFSANHLVSKTIMARRHMASYQIQTKLCKMVFWNPQFRFCRKRLLAQYESM